MTASCSSPAAASRRRLAILAGSIAALLGSHSAQAAAITWSNTGTDFNTGASWIGNTAPGTGDNATFTGAELTNPNLSASLTIQGLTFSTATSSGYTLSAAAGQSLTLTNTGTGAASAINAANTSGTNLISAPLILGGAAATTATFTQAAGGTLSISGNISSTNTITGLSLSGASIFTLSGTNGYSGTTTLLTAGATLNINSSSALSGGTLTLTGASTFDNTSGAGVSLANNINAGANETFTGSNALTTTGSYTYNSANRSITVNGFGPLTIGSIVGISGTPLVKTGTGTFAITGAMSGNAGGGFNLRQGTLIVGNKAAFGTGAFLVDTNAGSIFQASADLSGANAITANTTMAQSFTVSGANNLTFGGTFTNSALSNTLTSSITGGQTLTLAGNVFLSEATGTGRTMTIAGTGPTVISGVVANFNGAGTAGGLTYAGTGTLALTNANTYTGATTINGGTLNIGNGGASGSVSASSVLALGGGSLNYTTTGGGTQAFASTSLNADGASVSTVSGNTVNLGAITRAAGGTINFGNTGSIVTSSGASGTMLGGYATFGGTNFAVVNGASAITGLTTYDQALPAGGDLVTTHNDNLTPPGTQTQTAASSINSLTISSGSGTLALAATPLTFTSGGGLLYSGGGTYTISNSAATGVIGAGATGEAIFNVSSGGNLTISALVGTSTATAASLTTSGLGTVTLTGNNVYTGNTTVAQGTLQIGTGGATTLDGGTYAGGIANSGSLIFNSSSGQTLSGIISGPGSLTKTGTGQVIINNANTYSGATVVNGGKLTLGNGATIKNSTSVTVTSPGLLGIGTGSESGQFAAGVVIQGTGGVSDEINNANTAISLDRANTYTGQTTWGSRGIINAGVVSTYDGNGNQLTGAFGVNSNINFNGQQGELNLNGLSNQVGSLTGSVGGGGGVQLRGATITIGGDGTNASTAGPISNNYLPGTDSNGTGVSGQAPGGNVIKIGGGTQTFSSTTNLNSYEGTTTIKGGVLSTPVLGTSGFVAPATSTFNGTSTVTVSSTAGLVVGMNIFEVRATGAGTTITAINAGANTITLSGSVGFSGAQNIVPYGFGSGVGISGPAASNLVLDGGTLQYTGALASTDRLFTVGSNEAGGVTGTLDASGAGALTFSNTGSIAYGTTGQARTLGLTGTSTAANTLAPLIADNGAGLVNVIKSGTGTWAPTSANTYSGVTTISGGILSTGTTGILAAGGTASSIGRSTNAAGNLVLDGGTLQYANTGAAESTDRLFTVGSTTAGATGTLDASGTNAINFTNTGSILYGAGSNQTRTLGLTGTSTAANTFAPMIGDNGTGAVSVNKSGSGLWTLTNANTYTGATTITAGTLQVGNGTSGSLGSGTALTMGGGTFLLFGNSSGSTSQTVAGLTTTANKSSSIVLNPSGGSGTTLTITSPTLATGAGSSLNFNYALGTTNGSTVGNDIVAWNPALTSGIIGGAYTVTDSGGTGFATVNGSGQVVRLIDPGTAGLPVSGGVSTANYFVNQSYSTTSTSTPGSLVEALSGPVAANTVSVDTTGLASGANLAMGTNVLTITSGGGFAFSGASPYSITASGAGAITSGTAAGSINFSNGNSSTVTIGAPVTNNGGTAVSFGGTGTTVLIAANTYAGATTISGGTLQLGAGSTTGSLSAGSAITDNGTLVFNRSGTITQGTDFSTAAISGTGGVTQAGSGTVTLNAANTYSGGTTISAGTVIVGAGSTGAIGAVTSGPLGTGAITLGNGSIHGNGNTSETLNNALVINGTTGALDTTGTGGLTINGPWSGSGTVTVGSAASGGASSVFTSDSLSGFTGTVAYAGNTIDNLIFTGLLNTTAKFSLSGLSANQQILLNAAGNNTIGELSGTGGKIAAQSSTPTLFVNQSTTTTYSGILINGSATLGLTKANSGTLILAGPNTYTGGTNVQNGTLQVNTGGTLGAATGAVTMGTGSGGTLGTVGNLTLNTTTSVGAFTVQSNTSDTTSSANIGQLSIASGKTLTASSLAVGVPAVTSGLTNTALAAGATPGAGGTLTVNGNTSIGAAATNDVLGTTVVDFSGLSNFNVTSTAGSLLVGFGQEDKATLTLANANTINVGTLSVGDSNGGSNYIVAGQSVLNLGAGTNVLQASTINIGAGKGGGTIQFPSSGGTVNISGTNGAGAASITIGNSSVLSYQASGPNSLLLAGHTATVNAGTVILGEKTGGTGGTVSSQLTFDTGTFAATGIQMALITVAPTGGATGSFTVGGPAANSSALGVVNVSGNILLAGNTVSTSQTATGTLTIDGGTVNVNTVASATGGIFDTTTGSNLSATTLTLAGGTLDLHGGVIGGTTVGVGKKNIGTLTFQSGTLQNVAQINGGAALVKSGAGTDTLILSGANTYTGATTINAGTVKLGSANALGNGTTNTSGVSVTAAGAALDLGGFSPVAGVGLTLNGTGVSSGGALTNSSSTAATYAGLVALGSSSSIVASSGTIILSNAGTITGAGTSNLTLDGTATGSSIASIIGTGAGGLTIQGTGTWTLTGANTYAGTTTISAGTLQLGNGGVSGSLSGTTGITNNGMLVVNRNNPFLGSVDLHNAGITGTGGFAQIGSGTTTLDVANSFTGGTVISNGQVSASVSGSLGSGTSGTASVAIANAATLLLTGSGNLDRVRNDATINLGGGTVAIASGSSEGTAATVSGGTNSNTGSAFGLGALTLTAANSTLNFDSNGTSTLLVFSSFAPGAFTLNITGYANSTFDGTANSGSAADDRLVFNSNLTSDQLAAINFGNGMIATEIDLGNGYFEVGQAIPEPASLVYLGAALVGLTGWRNRRKARR